MLLQSWQGAGDIDQPLSKLAKSIDHPLDQLAEGIDHPLF
jgi:hypothetical protein